MKTRKNKQKRKQKGGSIEARFPSFSFTLHVPPVEAGKKINNAKVKNNMLTWSEEEKMHFSKRHLLILHEKTANGSKRDLCKLYFIPHYEGGAYAYLHFLGCEKKTNTFKPLSFVIVYKFLEVLQSMGIEFVFFSVAAAGDKYYKLYELYHKMGFACKQGELDDSNATKLQEVFQTQKTNNNSYFETLHKKNLQSKEVAFEIFGRCMDMYGHVPSVLAKIESQLPKLNTTTTKNATLKANVGEE